MKISHLSLLLLLSSVSLYSMDSSDSDSSSQISTKSSNSDSWETASLESDSLEINSNIRLHQYNSMVILLKKGKKPINLGCYESAMLSPGKLFAIGILPGLIDVFNSDGKFINSFENKYIAPRIEQISFKNETKIKIKSQSDRYSFLLTLRIYGDRSGVLQRKLRKD